MLFYQWLMAKEYLDSTPTMTMAKEYLDSTLTIALANE